MGIRDFSLLLVVCLCWGFNFIASAYGLDHFPPFLFTVIRFVLVLLVLFPWVRMPPPGQRLLLLIVCLCNGGLHFGLNFWALQVSDDVSSVAIALQVYVPITSVLAVMFLHERLGWRSWAAILVSFSGVLLVGFDPLVLNQLDSLVLTLFSAFFLALGTMLMKRVSGISAFSFLGWTAIVSLPVMILCSWMVEQDQWALMRDAQLVNWGGALYSAIISSILGHGLFFYLIQRHPVTGVAPYLLLSPIFAVIFGVLLRGDQPGWRLLLGGALVLGGILVINLRAKTKAQSGS